MSLKFLAGKVELRPGDCLDVLRALPDAMFDSVVTDPPYALVSITKRFGKPGSAPAKDVYGRSAAGFMGKAWDTGDRAFAVEFWAEVFRVLKPGGHAVSFGGTRTYHRLVCAIEDAGFEIRDQLGWVYGSGFPKSHDVAKGIDRAAGVEREVISERPAYGIGGNGVLGGHADGATAKVTVAATDAARQWNGWGTALKPAWEPICLARKPLIGTVAENVQAHGTGAINIDGCRVGDDEMAVTRSDGVIVSENRAMEGGNYGRLDAGSKTGRWPANIVHDGSAEVLAAFPDSKSARSEVTSKPGAVYGGGLGLPSHTGIYGFDDEGSAARFFYTAKADSDDRLGSKHPTVKPLDLMQWLVRLVTPKGGLVLDPFAGTGTTGEAAWREGMRAVLIEREPEYQADIMQRLSLSDSPMKRNATAKGNGKLLGAEGMPLFQHLGPE